MFNYMKLMKKKGSPQLPFRIIYHNAVNSFINLPGQKNFTGFRFTIDVDVIKINAVVNVVAIH